jgi:hypothetical protein
LSVIRLPEDIEIFSITALGWTGVADLTVPFSKVTTLGGSCFRHMERLVRITFDDSKRSATMKDPTIGATIFSSNINLTYLFLPKYFKTLPDWLFFGCDKLSAIEFEDNPNTKLVINSHVFRGCKNLFSVSAPTAVSLGSYAFEGCTKLQFLNLPKVKTIGSNAFYNCSSLKFIELPSVETIGQGAFQLTGVLANVKFGDALKTIDSMAFYNTYELLQLSFPASLETIGMYAFKSSSPQPSKRKGKELTFNSIPKSVSRDCCEDLIGMKFIVPWPASENEGLGIPWGADEDSYTIQNAEEVVPEDEIENDIV